MLTLSLMKIFLYTLQYYISDLCLFFNDHYSLVDIYRCHNFAYGCPDSDFFGDRLYECKYIMNFKR